MRGVEDATQQHSSFAMLHKAKAIREIQKQGYFRIYT